MQVTEAGPATTAHTAKTRSWWGWGNTEDAVTGDEARALVERVSTLLPDADLTEHAPPDPRGIPVGHSRVRAPDSLESIASDDAVDRLAHAHGKAFRDVVANLHGSFQHVPDAVLRPRHERDVIDILDWCTHDGIAVIPYGGGSSVVGGVEPRFDGPAVSLDMSAMDRVLEIDRDSRAARVQAGIHGPALEDALRPERLTLRHFPQSFEFSTLGGWLATRAGGHYATALTRIDALTESMRVVTPSGIGESLRVPGSGAGPSPDALFLGSEGTLGVITEAWMRLQDRPVFTARASVHFDDYERAVDAVRALAQSGLHPTNCRLLDPVEAVINAGVSSPGGVLVLGFESADHTVSAAMNRGVELCREHCGDVRDRRDTGGPGAAGTAGGAGGAGGAGDAVTANAAGAAGAWRSSFIRMPYQRDALAARSMIVETFETACTWRGFDTLRDAVTTAAQDAMADVGAQGVVSCRFTHVYPDGPAPYFGVYAAGRWGETAAQWDTIKAAVSEAIAGAGGTITHHHAIGRDHRPWYDRQRPAPFAAALTAAKAALDPGGILNPGVLVG